MIRIRSIGFLYNLSLKHKKKKQAKAYDLIQHTDKKQSHSNKMQLQRVQENTTKTRNDEMIYEMIDHSFT